MRVDVSFKHLEQSAVLDNVIDKNLQRVDRRVLLFKTDEAIHLSLHVEKNPHRDDYFCWVNMYLPRTVLKSQTRKKAAIIAINDCFAALLKQLDKFKHKVEKHLRKK